LLLGVNNKSKIKKKTFMDWMLHRHVEDDGAQREELINSIFEISLEAGTMSVCESRASALNVCVPYVCTLRANIHFLRWDTAA
jgi:hypothetical protein